MTPSNPRLPAAPDQIAAAEELGRSLFSSRHFRRERVLPPAFLEKPGNPEISVDRLTYAPPDVAVAIADRAGAMRGRTFYGWAVIVADRASDGRTVQASPLPDGGNPYHADIILPAAAITDPVEQQRHARELADAATWRPRP